MVVVILDAARAKRRQSLFVGVRCPWLKSLPNSANQFLAQKKTGKRKESTTCPSLLHLESSKTRPGRTWTSSFLCLSCLIEEGVIYTVGTARRCFRSRVVMRRLLARLFYPYPVWKICTYSAMHHGNSFDSGQCVRFGKREGPFRSGGMTCTHPYVFTPKNIYLRTAYPEVYRLGMHTQYPVA